MMRPPGRDLLKQDWSTPTKGVEAVVKCFDGKLADYQAGGLGAVETAVAPKEDPKVDEPVVK